VFYTHSSIALPNSPRCSYLSFNVTSSTAISDAWVTTGNFAGAPAYLALGGNDSGILHVGPLAAGQTTPAFFYACSSYTGGAVTAAQTYDIKTYSGNPSYGGTLQSTVGFSTTIDDSVIQAAANTVNALWADVNPAILGATATLTIDGDTGTIGCVNPPSTCTGSQAGPIIFSPATFPNWRADTYVVVASNIVLSGGNSATYNNALYIDSLPSAATTHYTATYYFRTASTTATTTTLSPVNFIASGTQIKHTNLSTGTYSTGSTVTMQQPQNTMLLAKAVNLSTLPAQGGKVTYTLSATNSGTYDVSLDSFNDVLPTGVTYVANSTTFNNSNFADPYISGSNLIWSSTFIIPAGTTRTLIFQATLPATPGTYTNSATAMIGNVITRYHLVHQR